MSRNIHTLVKWLPSEIKKHECVFNSCKDIEITCLNLINRFGVLVDNFKNKKSSKFNHLLIYENEIQINDLRDISSSLENVVQRFDSVFSKMNEGHIHATILSKRQIWKDLLWKIKLKLIYFTQEIINEIAYLFIYYGENLLVLTLSISTSYNNLISMGRKYNINKNVSICNNTCPYLMFPCRKISVTRLLQIIAHNRAELCCHKLIDCLLETYKVYESSDDDNSDNSSLEIYMTLTKHMSPPAESTDSLNSITKQEVMEHVKVNNNFANIEELILYEEKNILDLLNTTLNVAPVMLGNEGIKKVKGTTKICARARSKVLDYYQQILWGEVGNYLEHVILWWAACPLSARVPQSCQHLREWINQFIPTADTSPLVLSALANLADALGVHVTSASWDQTFRLALVASKTTCNPDTGKLFSNVLQDLVMLCNQCEITPDWLVGAPLDELPLVEQIPVLHRLDHTIHTTRLWAANESKKIANTWNMKAFFAVIHTDITNCLGQLNNLRMADHTIEIEKGRMGVHVEVCTLMRAKLTSEVKVNIEKLKSTPGECVEGLAKVCRTICLANLQMIFPKNSYWKQTGSSLVPENPSPYVNKYLNQILIPVLEATDDHVICNMILTLICESWLDHIYINKIKFSQYGACQLLSDFAHIATWLVDCSIVQEPIRKKLLRNEVLKRCEGVGRLLLRCPGERIRMVDKNKPKSSNSESDGERNELMPAEMYVPNQEQWLELRAKGKRTRFPAPACCGKP
ncbi:uncharacterized protein LOC108904989 [Anoplophora glabripennis]|uniref:uncharacterized protein LOC108904989 n=1 Tax=Anoplophora glabripennis TaxID=217634 RepID=UPI000873F96D|nr:uncharacterized protein LOC108904989 [Anoplophora glabripennis]